MKEKSKTSHKAAISIAAGLVTAAAAGAYFLYGSKNAKKYRSNVKSWMFKAKGEILSELEKLENVSEEQYHAIVTAVTKKYETLSGIDKKDVALFLADIKKQWKAIVSSKKARASRKK